MWSRIIGIAHTALFAVTACTFAYLYNDYRHVEVVAPRPDAGALDLLIVLPMAGLLLLWFALTFRRHYIVALLAVALFVGLEVRSVQEERNESTLFAQQSTLAVAESQYIADLWSHITDSQYILDVLESDDPTAILQLGTSEPYTPSGYHNIEHERKALLLGISLYDPTYIDAYQAEGQNTRSDLSSMLDILLDHVTLVSEDDYLRVLEVGLFYGECYQANCFNQIELSEITNDKTLFLRMLENEYYKAARIALLLTSDIGQYEQKLWLQEVARISDQAIQTDLTTLITAITVIDSSAELVN